MFARLILPIGLALGLAACQESQTVNNARHLAPIPPATTALMAQKGVSKSDPILMRSFKKESEIELWKRGADGKYALLKTYPMCRWSGQLGPKTKEGDRQAPEGFYAVTPAAMNPNSNLYLSFNLGYPNEYDQAHGRTGSHLMVHGSCSSRGCFAMTDEAISEVYAIAREAFAGGQRAFQFQSYPFRMTAENLAKHRADPNMAFWRNLKEGSDVFEVTRQEPQVSVSGGRYAFGTNDPSAAAAIAHKQADDQRKAADLVAKGVPAIKLVYEDGGQHQTFREVMVAAAGGEGSTSFAALSARSTRLGDISRPEALAAGPREILLGPSGRPKADVATVLMKNAAPATPGPNAPLSSLKSGNSPSLSARGARPAVPSPAGAGTAAQPNDADNSKPVSKRRLGFLGAH